MRRLVYWSICWLLLVGLSAPQDSRQAAHFTTEAGLSVFLVEHRANPMVELQLLLPAGSKADPANKAGLAHLVAWMFNEGAGQQQARAFQEQLEFLGVHLNASADHDFFSIRMTTLTRHLPQAWAMLHTALWQPRFDAETFQRALRDQQAALTQEQEDADTMASRAFYRLLYRDHSYSQPVRGTLETVGQITMEDVRSFRERWFRPQSMILAVAGDVDGATLRQLCDQLGAAGQDRMTAPVTVPGQLAELSQASQTHVTMPIPQTAVRYGTLAINRHDPDYYALYVMNQILGGSTLTGRLGEVIREQRGLVYSVSSYFVPLMDRGPFIVALRTRNDRVTEALDLVRRELHRIAAEGVTEAEREDAQRYLIGSFPLKLDGLAQIVAHWAAIGFYQLGHDYLERWSDRIAAVTVADIQRVAQRLVRSGPFVTVTAGGGDVASR
ncbi:MAG: insulinase family protein [Magnetococcales bacterium]|nr:insulinase family protein [Magnetococcales bacterium]